MSQEQEMYYVISASVDGSYIERLTKDQLEEELNDEAYGKDVEFVHPNDSMPDIESGTWALIIKGEVVVPKAVEVITKLKLP